MAIILDWVSKWCARGTTAAVLIIAVLLVVCLLVSIFFRYIIGYALSFPEELSMLLFAWLVLLAGSLGVREGFHVRLTIVTNKLPNAIQKLLTFLITTGVMVFGGILLYSGQGLVARTVGNISATIGYPIEILYYPAPVCGALIILHSLSNLFNPKKEV
ncbi:MAG: TRAP transporter small permease [Deltaproteobacteria bacterium]|nr:TRAP transporter small permease [Deltaproteobacteria bacterium]MBW2077658.1 TRAP transporter small permease [Deltaproteobacteria bacterium]MBW2311037.1 TRAP transporter small permease [Deltaproteobacteria bacterium]RLB30208.1 MAG: TRAP transporter small permease [Deltaproteobacteria bacterium]